MKRLFTAIKIKPDSNFLSIFDELQKSLKHEKIKWVALSNLHLTLTFFGETSEDKLPEILHALTLGLKNQDKFDLKIGTLGIFGSRYNPKLIWAGLQNTSPLLQLVAAVNTELKKAGYIKDRQNFVPHLTLGRIRSLSDKSLFQQIISDFNEVYFQDLLVTEVCLFESVLTREGPIYTVIKKFELR